MRCAKRSSLGVFLGARFDELPMTGFVNCRLYSLLTRSETTRARSTSRIYFSACRKEDGVRTRRQTATNTGTNTARAALSASRRLVGKRHPQLGKHRGDSGSRPILLRPIRSDPPLSDPILGLRPPGFVCLCVLAWRARAPRAGSFLSLHAQTKRTLAPALRRRRGRHDDGSHCRAVFARALTTFSQPG